jgi:hypothetical protein
MVRLTRAAQSLVRTTWAEARVRRIADALVERGTLSADEIYELICMSAIPPTTGIYTVPFMFYKKP